MAPRVYAMEQKGDLNSEGVLLSAGHDVKAKGIQAIADDNLHVQAGHDVDITADTNHFKNKRVETKKTSGVFTGGGIGITFGSKSEKHDYETEGWTQSDARSTLGSMNGNIRVSASYSKAKVDYAQVKEQAGISVGEDGMDVTVYHHTQLNGAIIESDAEASKNRFKTKSLTHIDIENRSEIKTESASMSAGSSGVNPMQALSSALSLLGNTNESARSTTQSAISGNIQIESETPEKLTALSRDTKNANQRVEKQDLQKVQERQEMAKVIGDISNNAISIATYNEREKINKLGLEKFKLEEQEKALKGQAGNEQQLAAIKQQLTNVQADITKTQGEIDRTYGIGSEKGMAIRAVTAALQAAVQNDTAGSLVALASPYLNKTIHEMTAGDTAKDKAANLMAHALLSAVEFQVTGKDPLTGAVAGVTGEVTAQILTQAIYNKTPNQLTANEKENISTLSQLAGGLAAALTAKANGTTTEQGGSFIAATSGTETAKRAVENNNFVALAAEGFTLVCSRTCLQALSGIAGVSIGIGLSPNEKEVAIVAAAMRDPEAMSKLTKEQVSYINEQILTDGGFVNNKELFGDKVWVPNADGGYMPVDPSLVTTTYGGKPVVDPRIFVNHTGGIEYPADYNLPTNTGGNQILNNDKGSHILVGGESQVGDWKDGVLLNQKYHPNPKLVDITGISGLKPAKPKTPVQGGGKLRARWKDPDGKIYEWDSQHGELEKYDRRGKHLGAFDYKTGEQIKPAEPKRKIEP